VSVVVLIESACRINRNHSVVVIIDCACRRNRIVCVRVGETVSLTKASRHAVFRVNPDTVIGQCMLWLGSSFALKFS